MKNKYTLLLVVVFFVALFLRFNQLGQIPLGFYQDESAIGYNAYSIMQTGQDEHGQSFPLYFKSFGDYKLPIYIYTTIIPIKFFGLTPFAVRFPSALFGFLTVVVFYFFVKEMTKNNNLSLIATALLAINPWHLHYSRATFEVSISLFLFVLGGLLLTKGLLQGKRWLFLFGTLCFVLNVYTYNLTRLLSPLLFAVFIFLHSSRIKNITRKEIFITIFISVVLLLPFFTTLLQHGGAASAGGTLIFSSAAVQAPLLEFRSYFAGLPEIFTKLFFNQWSLTKWQYINNIASYFSVPFFFISGSSHGNHGIGNVGQFYLFELPLIVIGIVLLIQKKIGWSYFLILWGIVVILVASLTREVPHATRSFFLIVPLEILSAFGLLNMLKWIKGIKRDFYRIILFILIGGFVFYNLIFYFSSYYVRFPVFYAKAWRLKDKALVVYVKENENKYDKIIFDKDAGFIYTSLLFYAAYPPEEFQKTVVRGPDDSEGFSEVLSFDKFEFKNIDWSKDYNRENTLFITTNTRKPDEIPPLKAFYYPKRPVVYNIKQEIIQYPVEEIAYVVVESKKK